MKIFPLKRNRKKTSQIDPELLKNIRNLSGYGNKRALFDLDNTLITGDIGDALFGRLKNLEQRERIKLDGTLIDFTWKEYQELISSGEKEYAYRKVAGCMDLVPLKVITDLTRQLMNSDFIYLDHSGNKISIPFVNQGMKEIVDFLKRSGYEIFVISASNNFSVKVIAEEYLGLDPDLSFGIEPELNKTHEGELILTDKLKEPVPVNEGKVSLYREKIGEDPPLITAGDSVLDFPMLDLVEEGGIVLWLGDGGTIFEELRSVIGKRAVVISPDFLTPVREMTNENSYKA